MIENLIIWWIKIYPLLSIMIFILFITPKKDIKVDPIKMLEDLRNTLKNIENVNPKFAIFIGNIMEEALSGNKMPLLSFVLFSCFIPGIRLVILNVLLFK